MKALVTKTFIDKTSGMQQNKGEIIDVDKERLGVLVSAGVAQAMEAELVPDDKPKTTKRKAVKGEE